MKCAGISLGNSHPRDSMTMEQFVASEEAKTPLGNLLVALTQESVWSNDYTIYASLTERDPFLQISHPTFLPEGTLMFYDDGKAVMSVRSIEDVVRKHLRDSQKHIRPAISLLQSRVNELDRVFARIAWDKAKAAVIAVFPEAVNATPSPIGAEAQLYAFSHEPSRFVFVARCVDNDFVGGVARVERTSFEWYRAGRGIEKDQQDGLFWTALAQAFAAHTFDISKESLRFDSISVSEKPWKPGLSEPYVVEKVVFIYRNEHENLPVEVVFGSDNLPERAFIHTKEPGGY